MPQNAESKTKNHIGPFHRFILKNTPVPDLIRHHLEEEGATEYEFIEDFYLPLPVMENLKKLGFRLSTPDKQRDFFLKERTPLRMGVLSKKGFPVYSHEVEGLFDRIETLLKDSGRAKEEFLLLPYRAGYREKDALPVFCPIVIVVWSADKTPLERAMGRRHRHTLPLPWVEKAAHIRKIPPPFVMKGWNHIVYGFLDAAPDGLHRKYLLKQDPHRLLLALIVSPDRPPDEAIVTFFSEIGGNGNPQILHKEQIGAGALPTSRSFSIEIQPSGSFRAITLGASPLLWRNEKRKILPFPDGQMISGSLHSGDRLLLLSGAIEEGFSDELEELFLNTDILPRQFQERIHSMRLGKILLLTKE